jgi:predicted ATP-grasp superfamily ATP-dependent carboligase
MPGSFIESLKREIERMGNPVLFPMTEITLGEILRHREELDGKAIVPFPGTYAYEAVSDKANLLKIAEKSSVPVPLTLFSTDYEERGELINKAGELGYPLVIKPGRSRFRLKDRWIEAGVRYASSETELYDMLGREPFKSNPFLLQERIVGQGVGIFLLMKDGEKVARFAHKRIREKPPSGGVSTLCESISPPEETYAWAVKLLESVCWTGVAMVEFKLDMRDKRYKLMEVNGRFWGSLQLAIASGVDFPFYLYKMAIGEKTRVPNTYRVGLKSRWELGDLDHLLLRLLKREKVLNLPVGHPSKSKMIGDFLLDFLRPAVRHEVMRLDDPGPFFFELKNYLKEFSK